MRMVTCPERADRKDSTGLMGVSKFANIAMKKWTILYYDERVKRDVFALPKGILAGYLRLIEAMEEHGADLRMPYSRAMGEGLFELRPRGREGIGRVFYCIRGDMNSSSCIPSSRRRRKHPTTNCKSPAGE